MRCMRTTLGIIPARGGSKGVPRKNIRLLAGKPLIAHTIAAARQSQWLSHIVVSSDDDEILDVAAACGAVISPRPRKLAEDTTPTIDVVRHVVLEYIANGNLFDQVMLLQPTSPLRSQFDIDSALELKDELGVDSIISVSKVERDHPYYMYTLDGDVPSPLIRFPDHIHQRQQFPDVYVRNGAIYIVDTETLLTKGSFYGNELRAFVMPSSRAVNIDSEVDFVTAETLMLQRAL